MGSEEVETMGVHLYLNMSEEWYRLATSESTGKTIKKGGFPGLSHRIVFRFSRSVLGPRNLVSYKDL